MSAINTGLQTAQYFTVGAMAVAIFDYCLTITQEVQLIWGRKWNVMRVTFTLARYVTFIGAAMTTFAAVADRSKYTSCSTFNSVSSASHMISIIAAEGLLIFRTFAFWQQSKKVLVWLLLLAAICIAGSVGVTKAVNSLNHPAPGANTTGCVFESGNTSAIQYGFLILFELVLIILNVYKRFHFYQDSRSRLVAILYRDGLVYMTCIIIASVANIFIDVFAPAAYTNIMDGPQLVIHGVLASRILFNLRESRESESAIIGRIIPLAHIHHTPSPSTTSGESTLINIQHNDHRAKDPC
ncbi:hypothetical protein DEU56DRAFT_513087 [Suillus clintonianus]|uniref:uncharacterized protein n=1 Tax=Suillus clintonianus TaxID=1904413 RepID=UPI001B86455C|nr:uncharacterized protein DEU56DRAFT_513087 [Suillus clintonianus]KAG2152735.1 hypothetical protein DEU56DRAFT_513087 [Suillus clintonianus]